MRLVIFAPSATASRDTYRLGAHLSAEGVVVDLTAALPTHPTSMRVFLEGGAAALAAAAAVVADASSPRFPLADVVLKVAPCPVRDCTKLLLWRVWCPGEHLASASVCKRALSSRGRHDVSNWRVSLCHLARYRRPFMTPARCCV
jgi:hypothetical protein